MCPLFQFFTHSPKTLRRKSIYELLHLIKPFHFFLGRNIHQSQSTFLFRFPFRNHSAPRISSICLNCSTSNLSIRRPVFSCFSISNSHRVNRLLYLISLFL